MRRFALLLPMALLLACGASPPRTARPVTAAPSPLDVLPPDTAFVLGIDVQALVASRLWAYAGPLLDGQPAVRSTVAFLRDRCHFDVTRDLHSIVAGVNASLDQDKIVFIVDGNFDEASLVGCLQALQGSHGGPSLRVKTEHRITRIESEHGALAVGWVTPHTILLSPQSAHGDDSVLVELLAQGPGAHDRALERTMARVPAGSIVWSANLIPPAMLAKSPELRGMASLAIGLGMEERTGRFAAEICGELASEEQARRLAAALKVGLPAITPTLGLGNPAPTWLVGSRAATLNVHVELELAQLPALVRALTTLRLTVPTPAVSSISLDEAPPPDVAAIPPYADVTASGLASKVLVPGSGTQHPALQDEVRVEFVGWTSDGKLVNSTARGGTSGLFTLRRAAPGWAEAVELMVVGEKRRFWLPEEVTHAAGRGLMVFDVKLVEILPGPPQLPPPDDVAAAPLDATRETDGLAWKVVRPGIGKVHPSPAAFVTFHFTAWTARGEMLQSSTQAPRPFSILLPKALRAWREVLPQMVAGEKRLVWAPRELATLAGGHGEPEVFELELLTFVEPVPAPTDLAAPPKDASVSASGLATRVLRPGTGHEHPAADATVEVRYTAWTSDGTMFDSTDGRGRNARLALPRTMAGLREGLPLMVVGEKRRLWIPEPLGPKGMPGSPAGPMVYDLELVAIDPPTAPAAP